MALRKPADIAPVGDTLEVLNGTSDNQAPAVVPSSVEKISCEKNKRSWSRPTIERIASVAEATLQGTGGSFG